MGKTLKILVVEDSEDDMELLLRELRRGGFDPIHQRVDTAEGLHAALADETWEIIVCDHRMPKFSSFAALDLIRKLQLDIPVIVVSGTVGESVAVATMRAGAHDYLMKDNLARFVPVVERELREAVRRRQGIRAEDQLRQAQKMEAVGQLTGGVAHDFNNLLSVIIGNLDFLAEELEGNDDLLTLVKEALNAALNGADLNRQLLSFSREQLLSPRAVDLNEHVSGMFDMLRRTLGETIEMVSVPGAGLWTTEVDPAKMESALLNLAVNARDAMPAGGKLTIETANIHIDDDPDPARPEIAPRDYVMLAVTDTGTGMTAEVMAQVLEPFFTTKNVGEGSGLGLSMVSGFVNQSGGHVRLDSEVGQGTTVKLYLPRTERAEEASTRETDQFVPVADGETVLMVEDDPDLGNLISAMLNNLGYDVLEAGDGEAALALIEDAPRIDLLLTDIVLPGGMNGREIATKAGLKRPGIKILFMSGYPREPGSLKVQSDTSDLLLKKPFRKSELARKLREALKSGD